jgi:ferritin
MISKKVHNKLLEQIKHEWESEYLYYAIMAWCVNNDYNGFAAWFRKQAEEEHEHGMKIVDYLAETGVDVKLPNSLAVGNQKFTDIDQIFKLTLKHEQKVTGLIHALVELSAAENDHTSHNFLQWYVSEQLEEEAQVRDILGALGRIKGAPGGLYMLERELAKRGA